MTVGRRFFNFAAALSAVAGVALAAVWVRSYCVQDRFFVSTFEDRGNLSVWSQSVVLVGRGGVGFHRLVQVGQSSPRGTTYQRQIETIHRQHGWPWPPPFHQAQGRAAYPDFRTSGGAANVYGFSYGRTRFRPERGAPATGAVGVVAPLWSLLAPTAFLPALWLGRRYHRSRRAVAGRCPHCGYDLRMTPERCPECGTVPASKMGVA